jgi:hypothetical protein
VRDLRRPRAERRSEDDVLDACIGRTHNGVVALRRANAGTHVARRNDEESIEAGERLGERVRLIEVAESPFDAERAQLVRCTGDADELRVRRARLQLRDRRRPEMPACSTNSDFHKSGLRVALRTMRAILVVRRSTSITSRAPRSAPYGTGPTRRNLPPRFTSGPARTYEP